MFVWSYGAEQTLLTMLQNIGDDSLILVSIYSGVVRSSSFIQIFWIQPYQSTVVSDRFRFSAEQQIKRCDELDSRAGEPSG